MSASWPGARLVGLRNGWFRPGSAPWTPSLVRLVPWTTGLGTLACFPDPSWPYSEVTFSRRIMPAPNSTLPSFQAFDYSPFHLCQSGEEKPQSKILAGTSDKYLHWTFEKPSIVVSDSLFVTKPEGSGMPVGKVTGPVSVWADLHLLRLPFPQEAAQLFWWMLHCFWKIIWYLDLEKDQIS